MVFSDPGNPWQTERVGKNLLVGEATYKREPETTSIFWVVVSKIFYFHPYLGKIPILTNIFWMGWNHQLEQHFAPENGWLG